MGILKRTDLLAAENVTAEFVPFTYGGPMIEAAIANRIDVVLAGEQQVLNLVSKSEDWRIVARLTRYRSAVIVPWGSAVQSVADLNGKTLAAVFGTTTHRDLMHILADNGLEGKVKLVNIDQAEHASVIAAGGAAKWGKLDGVATHDPTIAATVTKKSARILLAWATPALVAMRAETIAARPEAVRGFLKAYRNAYARYAADATQANSWYSEESRLPLTDADYAAIAAFEPNLQATSPAAVNVRITDDVIKEINRNVDVALKLGILQTKPDFNRIIIRDLAP